MHTTLVGVFVHPHEAQTAYRHLVNAGIDRSDIRLSRERTVLNPPAPRRAPALVGRCLSWLFGAAAHDEARSAAAARRGHVRVTVVFGNEKRAGDLSRLLEACGAVDIEERVEQKPGDGRMPPSHGRHDAAAEDEPRPVVRGFGAFDRRIGF